MLSCRMWSNFWSRYELINFLSISGLNFALYIGADLYISDKCNANTDSYSNLGHTYSSLCGDNSLLGEYNFSIVDYEVFSMGPSAS